MAQKNSPKIDADDLDQEAGGKRLVVDHKGERFEIADIAHDRPWKQVVALLADVAGERGMLAIEPALTQIIGKTEIGRTDDWSFADFLAFSQAVGRRIGASVGTPGE